MTERKPPGVSWQTWIDREIEQGRARGEFDGLAGHGKPIAGIERPRDELWWVRDKLRREGVEYLPPALAIRKEAAEAERRAMEASTEAQVREVVEEINDKIRHLNRTTVSGPPTTLMPFDVDEVVAAWRSRPRPPSPTVAVDPPSEAAPPAARRRPSFRWRSRRCRPSS